MAITGPSIPVIFSMLCLCAGPSCADTIYSCAGKDGAEVLQNMPCQPGSQVWVQPDTPDAGAGGAAIPAAPPPAPAARAPLTKRTARAATAASAASASAAKPAAGATPAADPVPVGTAAAEAPDAADGEGPRPGMPTAGADALASESQVQVAPHSEPALGMTQQQVRSILGEPTAITQEEVVQGKLVTWTYGDSKVLQFDTSGRLASK